MSRFSTLTRRLTGAAFAAVLVLAVPAGRALAQDGPQVLRSNDPNQPDLLPSQYLSRFNLSAVGDVAQSGVRSNGVSSMCLSNIAFGGPYFRFGCRSPQFHRDQDGNNIQAYFDLGFAYLAPASDMPAVIDPVNSGLQGAGYTANTTSLVASWRGGSDKMWASDRSGSELLAFGVKTTSDASCTNFSAARDGFMVVGGQLLPVSTCPPTHPPAGWGGRHNTEAEVYLDLFQNDPNFSDDPFAFWRVPEDRQRTDKFIGDFQSYGEMNDFFFEAKARYGAVIPGGSGTPIYHGWPTGLTTRFDAFYFGLPTLGGVTFWQATIVNESELVYGAGNGATYDSMYIGINYNPLMSNQASAQYLDTRRNAIMHNEPGSGCLNARPTPGSGCANTQDEGFGRNGAAAIVVLKSPLGDVRFKQFSDPNSDFFSPGHPRAGDTITINHMHICGFGGCYPNTEGRSQRAAFGLFSSMGENVLDGRSTSDLVETDYFRIFRSEDWPTRTGVFNTYIPGVSDNNPVWDYDKDGVPNAIHADNCGRLGCVRLWSDTLPGGFINAYGNIAAGGIGPFRIEPGDTVPLIIAFIGAPDSATIESMTNNAIDFYQRMFLGPEAAPPPGVVAVDAIAGGSRDAQVNIFLDNTTEDWVDPFLSTLDVSADAALNPTLVAQVEARADNNVAAYHIFKSCDGGTTYTDDGDCDSDPVSDPTSKWTGFGFQPYVTLEADEDGELPNTFTDNNVIGGITYTYVFVTETRGAEFNLVRGSIVSPVAEIVEFAPTLLGPLSAASTNPNVATVYVPINLAAGASRANVEVTSRTGFGNVPVGITVIGTSTTGGTFRGLFVDSIVVRQTETIVGGQVTAINTTVETFLLRTNLAGERVAINTQSFTREGDVTVSGLTASAPTETADSRVTEFSGGAGLVLLDSSNRPLLATTTLTGSTATPGEFFSRADFPFFTLNVNRAQGGTLNQQLFINANGDTLSTNVNPDVLFSTTAGSAALAGSEFGTLQLVWDDDSFGDAAPFNVLERTTIQAAVTASLNNRDVAATSSTDPALLEAIKAAAPTVTISAEDLTAFKLPFAVRNVTFGRDVQVVVTSHQESILLGQGADTIRVDTPDDVWVPGDVIFFVETITREVRSGGRTEIGPDGQPVTETVPVATFRVVLACATPRNSCDPTIGGRTVTGYTAIPDGATQEVSFFTPLRGGEVITFAITPAVLAEDVADSGARVDLANVHVVPNPYIFASRFERAVADRVLKFTNLPPEGRIRIFDVAGRFIQEITYAPEDLEGGDLSWNMQTREQLELTYGLYLFVLESNGQRKIGKFVVIR